jgi:hypothetical protein
MAKITAGVGSSHVPLLGVAVDQGKDRDDYFGPIFRAMTGPANGKGTEARCDRAGLQ